MIYLTINTLTELACFIFALIFILKDKDWLWRGQVLYLLAVVIVEIAGIHLRLINHISNAQLYTYFLIIECFFVSIIFYNIYKPYYAKKKALIIWFFIFLIIFIIELVCNNFEGFVSHTATLISVVFVLASLYYYYLKLNDNIYERLLFSAPFWWVTGTLFFYFGSTICNLFFNFLIQSTSSIRYIIFSILNIILYTTWSYAFLCRYLQRKSYF